MGLEEGGPDIRGSTALERARGLSQALADAARRARQSTRSRRAYTGGSFQGRGGVAAMRIFFVCSFVMLVLVPAISSIVYYQYIASDQFIAKVKFTVSGGSIPKLDKIGAFSGVPAIAIIQDTQIVKNYIESRAAVERLDSLVQIRRLYSAPEIDYIARFDARKPIEKLVRYWQHMVDVSIKMPSGIVELSVRAFTPEDSVVIAQAILTVSEQLINDMNVRMNRDIVASAEQQLDRASARLMKARLNFEVARNQNGIIDASKTADASSDLITDVRRALLDLQQRYDSGRSMVSETAPQMRALKARIDTTAAQVRELEALLTGNDNRQSPTPTLSTSMTKFSELGLEQEIAEKLYAGAAESLEVARATAESKAMYINAFIRPAAPEQSEYPRRVLFPFLIALSCLAVWGGLYGFVVLVRNYKA